MANSYKIVFTRHARKELDKLDRAVLLRIARTIDLLPDEPRPVGCLKVQSEPGMYRIRVGDYRVGYTIDDNAREITVIRVGHRREFYE